MVDVSVIIVNFNTKELVRECIDSIWKNEAQSGLSLEIIVVDNGSNDGSKEMLVEDHRITLITATENLGFGKANNLGVENAKGKFVLLLNSDTIVRNRAIKLFYDFFNENFDRLKIGVLGCVLSDIDGRELKSDIKFVSVRREMKSVVLKVRKKLFNIMDTRYCYSDRLCFSVEGVLGADMFLLRSLFNEVGGFDPDFFLYGEEVELQNRIKKRGLNQYLIRSPKIVHLEGASGNKKNGRMSEATIYHQIRGKLLNVYKHSSVFNFILFSMFIFVTYAPYVILNNRFSGQYKRLFLMLFKSLPSRW